MEPKVYCSGCGIGLTYNPQHPEPPKCGDCLERERHMLIAAAIQQAREDALNIPYTRF